MRRGCAFGALGTIGLCVLACALVWFVGLPRVQDAIADQFGEAIGTAVAGELAAAPVAPGTYAIGEARLTEIVAAEVEGASGIGLENATVDLRPGGIDVVLAFDQGGTDAITYTAQVAAEAGRFVVTAIDASDEAVRFFLPEGKLGDAIEDGVNGALASNNLRLTALELTDEALTLRTEGVG